VGTGDLMWPRWMDFRDGSWIAGTAVTRIGRCLDPAGTRSHIGVPYISQVERSNH